MVVLVAPCRISKDTGKTMEEGIIMQMGSFNPIHRMHKRIADDAIEHYDYPHFFCMAKQTCDKGENSEEELNRRADLITKEGYIAVYTDSGLFVDVIAELREDFPEYKIVFPVGEDTIYRFFRDWEAFYDPKTNKNHWQKYDDYKKHFDNVEWYVSRRTCQESIMYRHLYEAYIREHNNVVWSELDLDDISSTKIRAGEVPNE